MSALTSAGPLRRSSFFSRGRVVGDDRTRYQIVSVQQRSDETAHEYRETRTSSLRNSGLLTTRGMNDAQLRLPVR
jgi:hypothetical protein